MRSRPLATKSAVLLLLCLALRIGGSAQDMPPRLANQAEIRRMMVQAVDVDHKTDAIVVGIITKHGRQVYSYGKFDKNDAREPNAKTIFEIGSITKVFTCLLLSDMVVHGEVKLSDPVSMYLPDSVHMPTRNGKQITLLELATHHSGLPRMPSNFVDGYTVAQLYEFLSNYTLTRDPGAKYDYSNLGVGLLGHALALKAGMDYDTLLRTRITGPLNMNDTAMVPTPEMQQNLAPGHDDKLRPAPSLIMEAMAYAGAIRSDADDMLTFLAANMGFTKTPLEPAMKKMLKVRKEASSGVEIALGWHIFLSPSEMVWHNGGTNGYHAFVGYEPRRKVGVVILANSTNSTDDLARRILDYRVTFPAVRRSASDDAY